MHMITDLVGLHSVLLLLYNFVLCINSKFYIFYCTVIYKVKTNSIMPKQVKMNDKLSSEEIT